MKRIVFIFLLYPVFLFSKSPLLIYYGDNASLSYINQFRNVVLDPDNYNHVFDLKPITYGYLSIGEVENNREYFKYVKKLGVLKRENSNWKGSFFVVLRSGKWQSFVVNYLIQSILEKGYNGIFLDTVDSLILNNDKQSVIKFINLIKKRFPEIKLMMNRGFEIADKVNIDSMLFESTITSYDFKNKKYFFAKHYIKVRKIPNQIEKFSVDYWYSDDVENIKKIYKKALKAGFKPFVSDISLHELPKVLYDEDSKKFINKEN